MLIYNLYIDSADGQTKEKIEVSGSKMRDFTAIKRPNLSEVKVSFPSS